MDIYLIRHPKTVAPTGTCYGSLDLEAAPDALHEAATRLAPKMPADARIISSPQQRAHALAKQLGGPVETDERIVEMDFGSWEGKIWRDLPRGSIDAWDADLVNYAPGGGESLAMVSERVVDWWSSIANLSPTDPIAFPHMRGDKVEEPALVVVTHGGPLRLLAAHILGVPLQNCMKLDIKWGNQMLVRLNSYGAQITGWNVP